MLQFQPFESKLIVYQTLNSALWTAGQVIPLPDAGEPNLLAEERSRGVSDRVR